jgi:hypothetical protein
LVKCFGQDNFKGQIFLGSKNVLGKQIWVVKIYGRSKKFRGSTFLSVQIFLDSNSVGFKTILVKNILWVMFFWVKKNYSKEFIIGNHRGNLECGSAQPSLL